MNTVNHGQQNGKEPKPKQKASKGEAKPEKPAVAKSKAQPPSRDRTPAKPETKAKSLKTQGSVEKKISKEKEKPTKEGQRSTSKSRAPIDQKETKKLRKPSLKGKEASPTKVNGDVVTNGSLDSQNSLTSIPYQPSIEKKDEPVFEAPKEPPKLVVEEIAKEINGTEIKLNGDAHHDSEPEKENQPEVPQKPQDELAAIIDEEAEFRRKEKLSKKLSAKHRQKSVEDVQQPPPEPPEISTKPEKAERFQSSFKRESVDRPRTSLRPPSARPASSRPAAPRRRDKNVEIVLQPDETMKLGDISVKMENFSKELEDDGENLVIIEDSAVVSDNLLSAMNERLTQSNSNDDSKEDEQGKLVQQILETEKNFEGALGMEVKKTTEIVSFSQSDTIENLNFHLSTGIRRVQDPNECQANRASKRLDSKASPIRQSDGKAYGLCARRHRFDAARVYQVERNL